MISLPARGLYAITDCEHLNFTTLLGKTEQILTAGAVMLQYRNKQDEYSEKLLQASALQALCQKHHVPLIINDDIELAREIAADGVHLGKDDTSCKKARIILGPEKIIGLSCYNNLETAGGAEISGANYVAFGAFFPTITKSITVKAELQLLHEAEKKLNLPIVAIGGITPENGTSLIKAGADYLAVISGLYGAEDISLAANAYITLFNEHP